MKRKRPDVKIYVFNILMRLAVTMESEEAAANYYNVMRFARLADEAERFDSEHLRGELKKVRAQIPQAVLDDYLAARARNHGVNLAMVEWLAEGVFDYLLITQEDAAEFGLHRREQDVLLQRAEELGVTKRMSLHPGADEAALTLLARHWATGVRLRTHWSSEEDAANIAPFEDRPYEQVLREHVTAMNGVFVEDGPADVELFINAPTGGHQKDETEEQRAERADRLAPWLDALKAVLESGRRVALCDVAFPNGADNWLMTQLDERGLLARLTVYGGWNTAGNTTGTVLAQCAAVVRGAALQGHVKTAALNRQFLFERLLDDWRYQSHVRASIEKSARESGITPVNMGPLGEPIELQARRELRAFATHLAGRHFKRKLTRCEVALPWMRTFECDVRVELSP